MDKIPCKFCGDLFEPSRPWQEFCKIECRNKFHNLKKDAPVIKCTHCKNENQKLIEMIWEGKYLCSVCSKEFLV